jgi:mannitol/fructose-specific phosphotransferase system IIA component (Ntr-type)
LEILSNIASLLSQSEIREELLLSQDPQQLHSKIVQGSLSLTS